MKLAYFSCHAILEYDELKIFEELGIDYFSFGSYVRPQEPIDPIRPALGHVVSQEMLDKAPPRDALTKEFMDQFDVIVIMHVTDWIVQNWELFKGKRVIWRTIGQSTKKHELQMLPFKNQGMQIVRYSPFERNLQSYCGEDAIIRFYKDPDEFKDWNGNSQDVITISQDMKNRGEFVNYDTFMKVAEGIPSMMLYGTKNEHTPLSGGFLNYEEMKERLKSARAYFYTHSQPACYTLNFMEALMTGVPVVAIGKRFAESLNIAPDTYEVPSIIKNGENGFCADSIEELQEYIRQLTASHSFAKRISRSGRQLALEYFGKDIVKKQWKEFLGV